jgi:hypothetical protein
MMYMCEVGNRGGEGSHKQKVVSVVMGLGPGKVAIAVLSAARLALSLLPRDRRGEYVGGGIDSRNPCRGYVPCVWGNSDFSR